MNFVTAHVPWLPGAGLVVSATPSFARLSSHLPSTALMVAATIKSLVGMCMPVSKRRTEVALYGRSREPIACAK
jgi:hypothetical protein